ncbi:protein NO VEIN-like isoform X3 [Ipomoea triloba]|nr:protein NO VEIN-like isoform X3 [Ipomoea triloba]
MDINKQRYVEIEELLDFIAKKKSVTAKEKLGVRIQSLGMHITLIRQAWRLEITSVTEEITRLGFSKSSKQSKRKRKYSNIQSPVTSPQKVCKTKRIQTPFSRKEQTESSGKKNKMLVKLTSSYSSDSMKMFITTWKETCQANNVDEVFEKMMQFYNTRKRTTARKLFYLDPFVGLLHIAVTSIKNGMWDSIYDTFQSFSQLDVATTVSENCSGFISIDVESPRRKVSSLPPKLLAAEHGVSVEDIVGKISAYLEIDNDMFNSTSSCTDKFIILRKLCKLESWLSEQVSTKGFESLGYGDIWSFMEKHMHLSVHALLKSLRGDTSENIPLKASMLELQLDVLLSQALHRLLDNEKLNMKKVSELLARQFPLVCFQLVQSDSLVVFDDITKEKADMSSKCVIFSETLLKTDALSKSGRNISETSGLEINIGGEAGFHSMLTSKDAIKVLLNAPMLTDLSLWSHWDIVFAPSLGSLVGWLLKDVNNKQLLCLVTRGGKVIRVDHAATTDSFLEVILQRSPFETAVKLLSLLALYGGEQKIPLALLKCYTRKAFEVFSKNSLEMDSIDNQSMPIGSNTGSLRSETKVGRAKSVASRFILDCLDYLPVECCSFAVDILLSGLQQFTKDAPSAVLDECKKIKQRVMLHEIGFSLGIVEWINDYHTFSASSSVTSLSMYSESSCLQDNKPELNTNSNLLQVVSKKSPFSEVKNDFSFETMLHDGDHREMSHINNTSAVSVDFLGGGPPHHLYDLDLAPAQFIESIRQEEFGLNPDISSVESELLNKQHARLGRALHCLSQELYSQDSHFLLELVQNADDNVYPGNAEPTLTFILQDSGIVVLNNEQGFSAKNINALCDVGNSTKKGHNSGYIGKKGIGFKSVFRVTDAPEIHSNGFHIKFDITKGQIGFILPTLVPPCDIDLYTRLVYTDTEPITSNFWKTCIVLPFRSSMLEDSAINNIASMFSDLHPSLLLFLHRLQCIKFRDMLSNSFIVMRKEVIGDGIVRVSCGKEKMDWLVVSHELQADVIRSDVQTTEISMAFTLQETVDGNYNPYLNQQPVFAFLPLRKYGLKFIIQGDFVLPSSREEVDGDSPWNQWLLSEFPDLFINAEKSFCNLPCFRNNLAKGVAAYMSFVPLIGEVHGFFSSLPQMILSKLRMSNCLILEGEENEWVPPCKVLRNWTEQARTLLPDSLLREHLGLGYLHKDIVLSDSLARGLGIEEYGPKVLIQILSSLCCMEDGLKSMGLPWLSAWLNSIYMMSSSISRQSSPESGIGSDLIKTLRKIRFIPLSDGKFSSIDEGPIWLHADALSTGVSDKYGLDNFPRLYAGLRVVNSALFSADTAYETLCFQGYTVENISRMLYRVGVQQLSAHEIIKMHILPSFSDGQHTLAHNELMTDYLSFLMFHLQSNCPICHLERDLIIGELRNKALILTNHGYKRCAEVPIHFSKEYENPIDMTQLVMGISVEWLEVHNIYLKHPITQLLPGGISKWRNFFMELGITDFVQIVQVEKSIADLSPIVLQNITWDKDLISGGSNVKDWESIELVHLLSQLSANHDKEKSKHILEILDSLWDDCFSDKVKGFFFSSNGEKKVFESSFATSLCNARWIASSMDDELHHPKDLFYDCEAVHSILGAFAPYAVPKVRSKKLVSAIGLKTQVTVDDALSILKVWTRSESSFTARLSQMSKFYTFIWNQIATSELQVANDLCDDPFIFVPHISDSSPEDTVSGVFLSRKEVYWHDSTSFTDQMKMVRPERVTGLTQCPVAKMLCGVYPSLHDFFVNVCGVDEFPSFHGYLQILMQLSAVALPSEAAKTVFQVFLKWSEELKSGLLSSEDIKCLKDNLLQKDFMVLPTVQDKWVSLNPSFGIICWCDDDRLKKEFKHYENIDFLYFGELVSEEKELLHSKVSTLMQKLGIPPISEVVIRDAIYYGVSDPSFVASLVNWALPYAQRYIYTNHPKRFSQLKQSGFENLRCLKIVVVEKLFYRNVIKGYEMRSKIRFECSSLLKDTVLYVSRELDSHSLFMELSRFIGGGTPDLNLANFLHMITTMAESGSTEEQTEFFIINSQKMRKLPEGEPVWSLSDSAFSMENEAVVTSFESRATNAPNPAKFKKKPGINSNWPPADWKTASGFYSSRAFKLKTQAGSGDQVLREDEVAEIMRHPEKHPLAPVEINYKGFIEENSTSSLPGAAGAQDAGISEDGGQLSLSPADAQQALLIGRLGEFVAFKYLSGKVGKAFVKWVNETFETGLPYDLVVGDEEYIEVKATKNVRKDWLKISAGEWQFAVEKGELYSIAHVILSATNTATVTVYKNPAKLVQLGKLQLAITIN